MADAEAHYRYLTAMDSETFRDLMQTYGQDVWNLAYLLTKKRDMADDVTQEVFLSAYHNIQSFRGDSSIRTWLLSIARNRSINLVRSAFMRKVTLVEWVRPKATAASAEQEALDSAFADDIWHAVLALPLKLRETLLLSVKYDLTVKEIAAVLRVSEGTVKSRLSRARAKMAAYREEVHAYERL